MFTSKVEGGEPQEKRGSLKSLSNSMEDWGTCAKVYHFTRGDTKVRTRWGRSACQREISARLIYTQVRERLLL